MLKISVDNKKPHTVDFDDDRHLSGTFDGKKFSWDLIRVKDGSFHIIYNDRSYNVDVVKADYAEKSFTLSVNGHTYHLHAKDRFDELLQDLGFDAMGAGKVKEIKAPMPGLVLEVVAGEGQEIKKGDPVVVLEAMKMENVLKAPADGTVKKVHIKKGVAVEKNQVLLNLE